MKQIHKNITAALLAATMTAGGVATASAQEVIGGEEECSWELVIDSVIISGGQIIPMWHLERTCVKITDDVQPATSAN